MTSGPHAQIVCAQTSSSAEPAGLATGLGDPVVITIAVSFHRPAPGLVVLQHEQPLFAGELVVRAW